MCIPRPAGVIWLSPGPPIPRTGPWRPGAAKPGAPGIGGITPERRKPKTIENEQKPSSDLDQPLDRRLVPQPQQPHWSGHERFQLPENSIENRTISNEENERTSFGGGPSTVIETRCSPRSKIKPNGRCSSRSDLSVLLRTLRNSSQSAKIKFMCLSNALNVPTSCRPSCKVHRIPTKFSVQNNIAGRGEKIASLTIVDMLQHFAAFSLSWLKTKTTKKIRSTRERKFRRTILHGFRSDWLLQTNLKEKRETSWGITKSESLRFQFSCPKGKVSRNRISRCSHHPLL